jgi:AcrR family transcriptional regulator
MKARTRKKGRPRTGVSRDTNAESQRRRIVESAARLLPRHGIAALRLRDVAEAAGLSVGTIQHYFDTRDALLRETCRWAYLQRVREWRESAARAATPWGRIEAMFDFVYDDPKFESRALGWLEFCTAASRDPRLRAEMAGFYEHWREPLRRAIEDGIAAGDFAPKAPVQDVVDMLLLMIDGSELADAVREPTLGRRRMRDLVSAQARQALGLHRH